ncbi:hypothetical protein M409DRAFT_18747 [Zasmidium cellare ATCC 36951]|uniref:Uncharacterized protein n=1 Tax=Zasmidium cellare ATCC 36951 TaxID=1080233 RepID=A0A6A6CVN3_ZASCE|nr:uncharacterized protein M409DRAFT_18747 [Zasmidium cellare ATCC 36951]KAF2170773.1 hypothetical protein M409DRAFT_18747 [Zasmidium cellare ATCC 36951]
MPPKPYTLPPLTHPSFIGTPKPTCPAPSLKNPSQRCRNKRSCDLRRGGAKREAERVALLRDDLVLCWEVLSREERWGLADGVAKGSVCGVCERGGRRGVVREGILRGLAVGGEGDGVGDGGEKGALLSSVPEEGVCVQPKKHEGEEAGRKEEPRQEEAISSNPVEDSILVQPGKHEDEEIDQKEESKKEAISSNPVEDSVVFIQPEEAGREEESRKEAISSNAAEDSVLILRRNHDDDQKANRNDEPEEAIPEISLDNTIVHEQEDRESTQPTRPEEADSTPSTPLEDSILVYYQHSTNSQDPSPRPNSNSNSRNWDPISSTPSSARTASTRHNSSSPPTDVTLNSSPPDLPPVIIEGTLADFCFQTPPHAPSTPVEVLWTGPIHAVGYFPEPGTPSKGPAGEEEDVPTEKQDEDLSSTLKISVLELESENATLRDQLQTLHRDLDTANLKTRAARLEADRWRNLYHALKDCVGWIFSRNEVDSPDEEEDPAPELEVDDEGASWSSEAEEVDGEEVYWPLKVPKKREGSGVRVDSGLGLGSLFGGEEMDLPPVPVVRRRRRTAGMMSLGSIVEVEEREEDMGLVGQ